MGKNTFVTFETRKPDADHNEPRIVLYTSMMHSDAFKDLTGRAMKLYVHMKEQASTCRELPDGQFYFNKALYMNTLRLYTNRNSFYADVRQLVEHGFIDLLQSGRLTREKSIYMLSDRWQTWGKPRS